ncbi:hypothetical protein [Hydrogenophaga laconesensis]|uniref:Uncharacterized protein n=1 Tax=Hydrogenophaga laconesensis TaxID=1805971 RepID=A0ABU1VJL4_9BURK|nr:hypothetical protein [Hydrogenophaga laconesensis]MDR7097639.1 hypothetical protein [Hydrogenophaga laconesensis]
MFLSQKPAHEWTNLNKRGGRLVWRSLHPRAREFLFTEGTLQQLAEDNAAYAQALINGDDLSPWHSRGAWRAKEVKSGKAPVTVFSALERTVLRMATTAMATTLASNGQEVVRILKNKENRFIDQDAFQAYLKALLIAQDNACAITSLPLELDGEQGDPEMLCSLDRIDSSGHYEEGNLQVVCRFVNRWKSDSDDSDFRRLIRLLQGSDMPA